MSNEGASSALELRNLVDLVKEMKSAMNQLSGSVSKLHEELGDWKRETMEMKDFVNHLTHQNLENKERADALNNDNKFLRKVLEYYAAPFPYSDDDDDNVDADDVVDDPKSIQSNESSQSLSSGATQFFRTMTYSRGQSSHPPPHRHLELMTDDSAMGIHRVLQCDRNGIFWWSWHNQSQQWEALPNRAGIWIISPLLQLPSKLCPGPKFPNVKHCVRIVLYRHPETQEDLSVHIWKPHYAHLSELDNKESAQPRIMPLSFLMQLNLGQNEFEFEHNFIELKDWPGFCIGKISVIKCHDTAPPTSKMQVFRRAKKVL